MFQPLSDRVVVLPDAEAEKTAGGLVIPDIAKNQQVWGKVMAVGPGTVLSSGMQVPLSLKVGDHVLFGRYTGTDITYEGKVMKVFHESDILGVER